MSLQWPDEWPYRKDEGVGLLLAGYPDDLGLFMSVMMNNGCHPAAAKRILDRVEARGFDMLTVQSTLLFNYIAHWLAECGVYMEIIPPQKDWELRYDNGPWP